MVDSARVRHLLARHGTCRSQDSAEWCGQVTLPLPLATFYRDVGPVDIAIPGYGNPIVLPCLARLWAYQTGYRWDASSGAQSETWNPEWIVIGSEGPDPFVYCDGAVFFAIRGVWVPEIVYPTMNIMAASLAILGGIVLDADAAGDFADADCLIRRKYRHLAIRQLSRTVGDEVDPVRVLHAAGWEFGRS